MDNKKVRVLTTTGTTKDNNGRGVGKTGTTRVFRILVGVVCLLKKGLKAHHASAQGLPWVSVQTKGRTVSSSRDYKELLLIFVANLQSAIPPHILNPGQALG